MVRIQVKTREWIYKMWEQILNSWPMSTQQYVKFNRSHKKHMLYVTNTSHRRPNCTMFLETASEICLCLCMRLYVALRPSKYWVSLIRHFFSSHPAYYHISFSVLSSFPLFTLQPLSFFHLWWNFMLSVCASVIFQWFYYVNESPFHKCCTSPTDTMY